jgi:sugar phosphate permease
VAGLIADVTHSTFISGMNAAFLGASIVALTGAAIALLTRRGQPTDSGMPVH